MADLQSTVITGTLEATSGFANITEASFTSKVTTPTLVGVGNVMFPLIWDMLRSFLIFIC